MDAIRVRQIDEALGYEERVHTMVFDMKKKRVAQQKHGRCHKTTTL